MTPPYSVEWNTAAIPNGTYTISASAIDLAGNVAASSSVTRTVQNSVILEVASAVYDPILRAPRCADVAIGCTTGTLVNGRGPVGPAAPEPSQPNTIHDSCADGISGAYHADESLDSLTIRTDDGSGLASGKKVQVEANVWVYSIVSDRLDLYYAPDASSPDWRFIATLAPVAVGLQTLQATYTLPTGTSLQAIRGVFRYGGTAATCVPGSFNDHDDLVFAAAP
jgi:leucyl aminopeptidase